MSLHQTTAAPAAPSAVDCTDVHDILRALRKEMDDKGYVHIPGLVMRKLLICHGATEDHLRNMERGYLHRGMPKDVLASMIHRTLEGNSSCHISSTFNTFHDSQNS